VFLTSKAAYDVAALLSLLLYKVGDPEGETREEALLMLRCVATVEWGNVRGGGGGTPSATPPAPVMGDLSDSYSRYMAFSSTIQFPATNPPQPLLLAHSIQSPIQSSAAECASRRAQRSEGTTTRLFDNY